MGIKSIHVLLIVISILLSLFFGIWSLNHNYTFSAYSSFAITIGLVIYCIQFIKKIKAM